jgi:hypothetical protein
LLLLLLLLALLCAQSPILPIEFLLMPRDSSSLCLLARHHLVEPRFDHEQLHGGTNSHSCRHDDTQLRKFHIIGSILLEAICFCPQAKQLRDSEPKNWSSQWHPSKTVKGGAPQDLPL